LDEHVDQWTGGLPPAAHERIERQRASGTAGSLLSAPAAAALRSAGLAPVGEVFGCLVMNIGWSGGTCGVYGLGYASSVNAFSSAWTAGQSRSFPTSPVLTTGGARGRSSGFGSYVKTYEAAWHGALDRMLTEAALLGAEGVVGVTIERSRLDGQAWEYTAMGTAVRTVDPTLVSRSDHRTDRAGARRPDRGARLGTAGITAESRRSPDPALHVWASALSAEDTAAAVLSSMVPRGIVMGLSISTKHEDYLLQQQRRSWSNTEVDGLTELLTAARQDARAQLTARASAIGGTDLVLDTMSVGEFETPCGEEKDLHAEALFVGTVLAPGPMSAFRSRDDPRTGAVLTVLPLDDSHRPTRGRP
jgi:uncharacterized protein YbjQ (UPF0145 family)